MGIPAHPLVTHATVVFVPLLALVTIGYALLPFVRPHTRWVLGVLALVAPLSAWVAKLSGDAALQRGLERGWITEGFVPTIEAHQELGNYTLYSTIPLAVLALVLVFIAPPVASGPHRWFIPARPVPLVLGILSVASAAVTLYYVIRTGDSGAQAVWIDR